WTRVHSSAEVNDDATPVRGAAMLPQVDPLPGAEREPPVEYRDRERGGGEDRLDVGRHVVRPLRRMREVAVALRHEAVEPLLEVMARARIGVFLNGEAGGGVADEDGA